jgi:hypothetical protein
MRDARIGVLATGALLLGVALASAHHVPASKFDPAKPVTISGRVTQIDWLNPHVHIFVNAENTKPRANWVIELESTVELRRNGWSRSTLKIGDVVTVQGIAARDGSPAAWANSVVATETGARVFTVTPAQPPPVQAGPTPRWPDGQPRLGPPPDQIMGYWAFPSATSLVQQGATVQADEHGLLLNLADIDRVAPFQRWARDLYELRQRNFLKDDPMFVFCKPQSGPRIFQRPYGVQFLEERDQRRIRVMMGGGNQNWRFIYTDGRAQSAFPKENADNPLYWGRAVGKWEGDTLVAQSEGFNDGFWFSNGGLPHTQQLRLTERFSRPALQTLQYDVTIDDPGAYTRTWSSGWTLRWIPNEELPVYYCQDNRP